MTDHLTLDETKHTPLINNVALVMQMTDYLTLDITRQHTMHRSKQMHFGTEQSPRNALHFLNGHFNVQF